MPLPVPRVLVAAVLRSISLLHSNGSEYPSVNLCEQLVSRELYINVQHARLYLHAGTQSRVRVCYAAAEARRLVSLRLPSNSFGGSSSPDSILHRFDGLDLSPSEAICGYWLLPLADSEPSLPSPFGFLLA